MEVVLEVEGAVAGWGHYLMLPSAAQIAEAAGHVSDGNSARMVSGGNPVGLQGYKVAAVANTAGGFVFEYRRLGGVPGELCYNGGVGAAGVPGVAWGFPSLILKDNYMGVAAGDMETVLASRNHAEALVVGGGHMWRFVKELPWVRRMAVAAMPEQVNHSPEATVATVSAAVGGIVGEVGLDQLVEREVVAGKGYWYNWAEEQNA